MSMNDVANTSTTDSHINTTVNTVSSLHATEETHAPPPATTAAVANNSNTDLPLPLPSSSASHPDSTIINAPSTAEKQSETQEATTTTAVKPNESNPDTSNNCDGNASVTCTPKPSTSTSTQQQQQQPRKTPQSRRGTPVKLSVTQRPFIGMTLDEYFQNIRKDRDKSHHHQQQQQHKSGAAMDVDVNTESDWPDANDSDYDPNTAEHNSGSGSGSGGKIGSTKRKACASSSSARTRSTKRRTKHSKKGGKNSTLSATHDSSSDGDTLQIHEANGWITITHSEAESLINAVKWTEFRQWLKQNLVPLSHHDMNTEAQTQKFAHKMQRLLALCTQHSCGGVTSYCVWLQVPQKEKWILLEIKAGDWYTNCTSEETMMGYATQKGTHHYWFFRVCESLLHKDNTILLLRADKGGVCGELVWLQKGVYVSGTDALAIENAISEALNLQWTYLHDDSKIVMGGNNTRKNSALYLKTVRAVARQKSWYAQALYQPFTCSNWPCQNDRDQTGVEPGSVFNQNAKEYRRAIEYVRNLSVADVRRMFIRNTNWAKHSSQRQQQQQKFAFSWSDIKEIDEVLLWLQTDDPYFDRYNRPYRLRKQDRRQCGGGGNASGHGKIGGGKGGGGGGGKIGATEKEERECSCSESDEECDVDIRYFGWTSDDNGEEGVAVAVGEGIASPQRKTTYANEDEDDDDDNGEDDDDEYCIEDDAGKSGRKHTTRSSNSSRRSRRGGGGKYNQYTQLGRSFIGSSTSTRKTRSRARADPTVIMKEKLAECKQKCEIKRWRRRRIKVKHSKDVEAEYILRKRDDFSGIYHARKHQRQHGDEDVEKPQSPPHSTMKATTDVKTPASPKKTDQAERVVVEYAKHLRTIGDVTNALYSAINPQVWGTGRKPVSKTLRTAKEHLLKWYLKILSSFSDEKVKEFDLTRDFVEYHNALKIIEETKIFGKKGCRRLPKLQQQQLQQQQQQQHAIPPPVHITPQRPAYVHQQQQQQQHQRAMAQTTGPAAARSAQARRPQQRNHMAPSHTSPAHYYPSSAAAHAYYPNYQAQAPYHAAAAAAAYSQQQQQQQQQHRNAMYYANANANANANHYYGRALNTRENPINIPSSANTSVQSSPNRPKTQPQPQTQAPPMRRSEEPLFNVASQRQYEMDRESMAQKYQLQTPPQHTIYQRRHHNTQPPPPQPQQQQQQPAYYQQPPAPFAPAPPPLPPQQQHPHAHAAANGAYYPPAAHGPAAAPWMYHHPYSAATSHLYHPSPYMNNGYFAGYNQHLRYKLAGDAEKLKQRQIEERQKLDDHKHFLQQDLDSHLNVVPESNAADNGQHHHEAQRDATSVANDGGNEPSAAYNYNVNRPALFESLKGPAVSSTTTTMTTSQSNKNPVQPPLRVHKDLVDSICNRASNASHDQHQSHEHGQPVLPLPLPSGPRLSQPQQQTQPQMPTMPTSTQPQPPPTNNNNDTDSTLSTMTVKSQVTNVIDSDSTTTNQAVADGVVNLKMPEHNQTPPTTTTNQTAASVVPSVPGQIDDEVTTTESCAHAVTITSAAVNEADDSDVKISRSPSPRKQKRKKSGDEDAVTVEFAPLNKVLRVIKDIHSHQNEIQRMPFDSNATCYSDHESDYVDAATATGTTAAEAAVQANTQVSAAEGEGEQQGVDTDANADADLEMRDETSNVPQSPKQRAMKRPFTAIESENETDITSPPPNKRLKFDLQISPSNLPKFDPNMSTDELIEEIRKHDASYDIGDKWCRYCGAKASAKWSTHNQMVLCYAHSQHYKKDSRFRKKIDSYKRGPRKPINDTENTEHKYLASKLKRLIASIKRGKS